MGKNFFDVISKPFNDAGDWAIGAVEDAFNWSVDTTGNVGEYVFDWTDKQTDKIAGVFSSPMFMIVAAGVVLILVMKR